MDNLLTLIEVHNYDNHLYIDCTKTLQELNNEFGERFRHEYQPFYRKPSYDTTIYYDCYLQFQHATLDDKYKMQLTNDEFLNELMHLIIRTKQSMLDYIYITYTFDNKEERISLSKYTELYRTALIDKDAKHKTNKYSILALNNYFVDIYEFYNNNKISIEITRNIKHKEYN